MTITGNNGKSRGPGDLSFCPDRFPTRSDVSHLTFYTETKRCSFTMCWKEDEWRYCWRMQIFITNIVKEDETRDKKINPLTDEIQHETDNEDLSQESGWGERKNDGDKATLVKEIRTGHGQFLDTDGEKQSIKCKGHLCTHSFDETFFWSRKWV